jgi:hypothetical protein
VGLFVRVYPLTLRDPTGGAPAWSAHEPAHFVMPAIFRRESIPHALDARLKIAGMTDWNNRFTSASLGSHLDDEPTRHNQGPTHNQAQ